MKTNGTIAALVGALTLLSGCRDIASIPDGVTTITEVGSATANSIGSSASNTIVFDAVQYDRALPGGIIPCVTVLRGLHTASLAGDRFLINYTITYLSDGVLVTKTATSRLSETIEHPHESRLDLTQYALKLIG